MAHPRGPTSQLQLLYILAGVLVLAAKNQAFSRPQTYAKQPYDDSHVLWESWDSSEPSENTYSPTDTSDGSLVHDSPTQTSDNNTYEVITEAAEKEETPDGSPIHGGPTSPSNGTSDEAITETEEHEDIPNDSPNYEGPTQPSNDTPDEVFIDTKEPEEAANDYPKLDGSTQSSNYTFEEIITETEEPEETPSVSSVLGGPTHSSNYTPEEVVINTGQKEGTPDEYTCLPVNGTPVVIQVPELKQGVAGNSSVVSCSVRCPMCPRCPEPSICNCPLIPPCPDIPACPSSCPACPTCPSCEPRIPAGYEYNEVSGHYYRYYNVPLNWYDAEATCQRSGAHLVIINSQEEADFVMQFFERCPENGNSIYVGFHDLSKEGVYRTVLGESLEDTGFEIWASEQPNNDQNEDCGTLNISGGLNDIQCLNKLGFVCELPL